MNWPMHKLRSSLSQEEKFAFRLHLGYAIPDGIILGILALNEFVFIRSLKGSSYQLGLLFQFSMVVFVALIFFYSWLNGIPDKRRLLRKTALITRLPLALLAFFPAQMTGTSADGLWHIAFLAIFFVYYAGTPVIYPSINLFLKSAYSHSNFGQLFSVASSLNKLIMLVVTFAYGLLLDIDASAYRFVFPFVAALGVISVFFLSKIPISTAIAEKHASIAASVKHSMQSMLKVIRTNKPYLHFEIGFMMYGLAFMGSITLVPLFFDQVLHLNYSSVAFYKNAYNILAIVSLPFFGRLLGRLDPRKFAVITFFSMMGYLMFLMITEYFPQSVEFEGIRLYFTMAGYILFHSVFAATMSLLWSIGSAYFCEKEEAGLYQGVHLSLTGVRAIFAPLMGVVFYELWGFTTAFLIAAGFLLCGIAIMVWSYKRDRG